MAEKFALIDALERANAGVTRAAGAFAAQTEVGWGPHAGPALYARFKSFQAQGLQGDALVAAINSSDEAVPFTRDA